VQSVPSVAAAHSGPVPASVPTFMTPPETPSSVGHAGAGGHSGSGGTHSASSSTTGAKLDTGDIRNTTEMEHPGDSMDDASVGAGAGAKREGEIVTGREEKRRRVEPTLVSRVG